MSTPVSNYNITGYDTGSNIGSNTESNHLEFCNKLNNKAVNDLNSSTTQQQLNDSIKNVINSANNDLGRPMTYAEMRERFG